MKTGIIAMSFLIRSCCILALCGGRLKIDQLQLFVADSGCTRGLRKHLAEEEDSMIDRAALEAETIVLARHLLGEGFDPFGEKRATLMASLALDGQELPDLSGSGGKLFAWKEIAEFVFALASFLKTLSELWSVYGRQRTPKEELDSKWRELDLPESTKQKIIENQEYIVDHLARKFDNGDP